MDLNEYQEFVLSLASPESVKDDNSRLLTAALGLTGESSEIFDVFYSFIFSGDKISYIEESGDLLWYVAFACNAIDVKFQELYDVAFEEYIDIVANSLIYTQIAYGLTTYSGRFADNVKKHCFHGKELNKCSAHNSLVMILRYILLMCFVDDVELNSIIEQNVNKLKDRYPTGEFNSKHAHSQSA